jgi:3-(3-hydroxy-phenyl)propionate hydroxylase
MDCATSCTGARRVRASARRMRRSSRSMVRARLFAHLYNPDGVTWGWTLLLFDARRQDALAAMRRALAQVRDWEWMRPRSILGKSVPEAGDATALFDLDGVAHSAYGIEGAPALVLVRPDGHIAFRGPLDKPELLRAYCSRVFGA